MITNFMLRKCYVLIAFCYTSVACIVHAQEEGRSGTPVREAKFGDKDGLSTAGLISVIGKSQQQRSGILSIAEKLKKDLFELGGKKYEEQKLPIIIQLIGNQGDERQPRSMVSKLEKVEGLFRIKLYIHLANTIDHDLLQYHLMELLLYERGLSAGQSVAEGERVLVNPWLIIGMLEAVKIEKDTEEKDLYQADIDYFEVLNVEDVFTASELEFRKMIGLQPMAFRAISGAMVNALLRQEDGPANMEAYIAEFATFKGEPSSLMRKHFPGMNKSKSSLQKWVNLEMLELGTADTTQALSILETDDRLENYLKFRYRDEDGVTQVLGIHDYAQIIDLEAVTRVSIIRAPVAGLQRLSYRCFPEYRPIIFEYLTILNEIAEGKDQKTAGRLVEIDHSRKRMKDASERVTDYLNWYYITQSDDIGGDFRQYREISEALEKESKKTPPNDHMKDYLNSVQRMFTGK